MPEDTVTLTASQLQKLLQEAGQYGINSPFGPSSLDQFRNAQAQMQVLQDNIASGALKDQNVIDQATSQINSAKASAVIGGALTAAQGLMGIANTTSTLSRIADTNVQQNQVDSIGQIGTRNYNNFDQITSEYDRLSSIPTTFSQDDIRGLSNGQKAGNVFSSTLTGATTGLSVGGPWGALVGGVVGLGAGIGGVLAGDSKAKKEKQRLEAEAAINLNNAQKNLDAATNRVSEYNFRKAVTNVVAEGGELNRKDIDAYIARARKRPRRREYMSSGNVMVRHGKGGTTVRFK